MRFVISGETYNIRREDILQAAQGATPDVPDARYRWYVDIRGEHYPIKQLIRLVTGRPNGTFNAGPARHVLERLRFDIKQFEDSDGSAYKAAPESDDSHRFAVTIEEDEGGFFVASVPALPGCHSQGRTKEAAISNVKEAIRGYVASMRRHGETLPPSVEVQQVEVAV